MKAGGILVLLWLATSLGVLGASEFPGATWRMVTPAAAGLSATRLEEFRSLAGGSGCVVRHGVMAFQWGDSARSSDIASAFKPVLTTLLLLAVQEGRIAGVDTPVATVEPRLRTLNGGKDAVMTWRHLTMQTSGYGWSERPGTAYAYNDYAITLYYDTLMERVWRTNSTALLRVKLATPLDFEDHFTFEAFGPQDRPGRLALSCRDFARLGLLYLRGGQWRGRTLLDSNLVHLALHSPLDPATPLTRGVDAAMLPGQRTMGGRKNITPVGPGFYSFNWWLNGTNAAGQRLFVDAPADTFIASGHGGKRALVVMPSLDLIAVWNDSAIDDHDRSPGNPATRNNRALRALVSSATGR